MDHSSLGLKIRSKLWLEKNGKSVFGIGRFMLLKAIDSEGSISKAAKKLNISYRRAWSHLDNAERNLGIRLLEKKKGGTGGGRSILTSNARILIERFEQIIDDSKAFNEKRFKDLFK